MLQEKHDASYEQTGRERQGQPALAGAAIVEKSSRTWLLWLIPVGAVGLCLWFAYRDYISAGAARHSLFSKRGRA